MPPFIYNEYEAICAAQAMIESAHAIIEEIEFCEDERDELFALMNSLNKKRVHLLGGGDARPYNVSDLMIAKA